MPSPPYRDPFEWFSEWLADAEETGIDYPNAMGLATASAVGHPSVRQVLLKDHGPDGFVFYTNYRSFKGLQLDQNPWSGLNFYWRALARQIRVDGPTERLSEAESDAYFAQRSRGSQIGAWASHQSAPLESRQELMDRVEHYEEKFEGRDVPRPDFWGGYRVVPVRFEFWQARNHRLHDRWKFERDEPDDEDWEITRLNP